MDLPGLGRQLALRRPNRAFGYILAGIGVAVAAAVLLIPDFKEFPTAARLIPLFLSSWAVAQGVVWISRKVTIHEKGLLSTDLRRRRELNFDQVASMRFFQQRQYYNGIYVGTVIKLEAKPAEGKNFKIAVNVKSGADDLQVARDRMASAVADRLLGQITDGQDVQWVDSQLTSRGLRYRKHKLVGSGEEVLVPFQDLRFSIDSGVCYIFAGDEGKASLRLKCDGWNFYPGFELLGRLATLAEVAK